MAELGDMTIENEDSSNIHAISGTAKDELTDTDAYTNDDQHSSNNFHELNSNSFEKALEASREKEPPCPEKKEQLIPHLGGENVMDND